MEGIRGPQVCRLVGISYRQLDYWARTGLAEPSVAPTKGSGYPRLYSLFDIKLLRLIVSLRSIGLSVPALRPLVDRLRILGPEAADPYLLLAEDLVRVIEILSSRDLPSAASLRARLAPVEVPASPEGLESPAA
jgi:DNA-binding transcriptional MerR regulator